MSSINQSILVQICSVTFHIKRSTDSEYLCYRLAVGENQASKKQNALTNEHFTFVDGSEKVVPQGARIVVLCASL